MVEMRGIVGETATGHDQIAGGLCFSGDTKDLALGLQLEQFHVLEGHLAHAQHIQGPALGLARPTVAVESQAVLHVPFHRLQLPEVEKAIQHSETYHLLAAIVQVVEDGHCGSRMTRERVDTPARPYDDRPVQVVHESWILLVPDVAHLGQLAEHLLAQLN